MLPPDFEERKRAAQRKSAQTRVLTRLRDNGVDPDTFPHRFLSQEEEATFLTAVRPWMMIDCPLMEKVPEWASVIDRIAAWAASRSEVAIWYEADPGNGGLVISGSVLAGNVDRVIAAVKQRGNVMLATPDGRSGCVYFEEEHENHFGVWNES
jgi:hypothetical protein